MTKKVVVFGAFGFVGSSIVRELKSFNYNVLELGRADADLLDAHSVAQLRPQISDGDTVVLAFAKAPAKNLDDLTENISMMHHVMDLLRSIRLSYVLNISSDAIYSDSTGLISENSIMAPTNAHGIMHCMRERLVDQNIKSKIGHIRPTLIFGRNDPHNGYGPNSFLRKIESGDDITLFGNGEELRDHIHVSDVATIATHMIKNQYNGGLNAVTGRVRSFFEIASSLVDCLGASSTVRSSKRVGPMPHNGYRAFDNTALKSLMPRLEFKTVESAVKGGN